MKTYTLTKEDVLEVLKALDFYADEDHNQLLYGRIDWEARRKELESQGYRREAEYSNGDEVYVERGDKAHRAAYKLRSIMEEQEEV